LPNLTVRAQQLRQFWANSHATRLEDASHYHRPSTWASAASASGSQHVIAMAREVLWGWGARPMRSLA
jgi:hypothetical protein